MEKRFAGVSSFMFKVRNLKALKQVFTYQPVCVWPYGKCTPGSFPYGCGIFTVYDEVENRMIFDAFCKTDDFIQSFYHSLLEFAKKTITQKDFIDAWIFGAYNKEASNCEDDSPEQNAIFYNKIKSPKIEEYLASSMMTKDCRL